MPERFWQWELLDVASDPVVADVAAFDARISHFRVLAEAIRVEGQRLAAIASGEALRGKYADELRSVAGEVGHDFSQVVGRYDAVVSALTVYRPAMEEALTGSEAALNDAIDASGAQKTADALTQAKPSHGAVLTVEQTQSNADKVTATAAASARLDAAKARLASVLGRLDDAGQRAATAIRAGFNDGLKDSRLDRLKYDLKKFLKILVKVLTYIGMALAVLALFIPGIGQIVMAAGLAIGVAVLAADIALKAMGEGSWVDIGIGIAGLLTFGAAKFVAPLQSTFRPMMTAAKAWGQKTWTSTKSWLPRPNRAPAAAADDTPFVLSRIPPNRLGSVHLDTSRFTSGSRSDREIIEGYTGADYTRMNRYTQGAPGFSAESSFNASADIAAAERALDARPAFVGTSTRGTSLPHDVFWQFKPGATVTTNSLWSTSTDATVSRGFAVGKDINSHFTIIGKSGRKIQDISIISGESEVLFKPWTQFRVESKVWDPVDRLWRFGLREV